MTQRFVATKIFLENVEIFLVCGDQLPVVPTWLMVSLSPNLRK